MQEKDIEIYLRKQVRLLGGEAYKFVSPGNSGVPDRMVCLPGGRIAFVELKVPGKKPTVLQIRQQEYLQKLGLDVWVIDSKSGVDKFILYYQGEDQK